MPILMDLKCNTCEHVIEDHYDEGGKGVYGTCPACFDEVHDMLIQGLGHLLPENPGQLLQVFSTGGFTMGATANIDGKSGRTSDGTKWQVQGRPRRYDYTTKKFGGEVL